MKKTTPKQLKEVLDKGKVKVLDVRSEDKFELGHLKHEHAENINIPKNNIFDWEKGEQSLNLPFSKSEEVVVTCTTGNSATKCSKILSEKGYNVTVLEGGMVAWNKDQ